MRQVMITKHGGPGVLQIREGNDPLPRKGQVKIRVRAAGINFADILARRGMYPGAPKPPCVLGYEVAGEVESVGESVDLSLVGKPVLAGIPFGGYSEAVVVPASYVVKKPDMLSFEQAAGIPVNYLTAYQLLVVMGGLRTGESVLIHNAGGGVGLAALDIAKHIGATTYGTASAPKHDFLKQRGLDHAIDYRHKDWAEELHKLTQGRGVELIIDPFGGRNLKKSYRSLRKTGRLGAFGISEASEYKLGSKLNLVKLFLQTPRFHPMRLMNWNKGVFGVFAGNLWDEVDKMQGWMQAILKGVEEGWVRPHTDKSFSFENAPEAHRFIEERKNRGKVVLVP